MFCFNIDKKCGGLFIHVFFLYWLFLTICNKKYKENLKRGSTESVE